MAHRFRIAEPGDLGDLSEREVGLAEQFLDARDLPTHDLGPGDRPISLAKRRSSVLRDRRTARYTSSTAIPAPRRRLLAGGKMQYHKGRMAGITYWNLIDGAAWKNEGKARAGLVDEQVRPKPAYQALDQLIHHDWKTRLAMKTDAQGQARFRGFHGKYEVIVTAHRRTQRYEIDLVRVRPGPHKLTLNP